MNREFIDLTGFFNGFIGIKVKNTEQSKYIISCSKQRGYITNQFDIRTFNEYPIYYINTYNAKIQAVKSNMDLLLIIKKIEVKNLMRSLYFSWINLSDGLPDKIECIMKDSTENSMLHKMLETKIGIPTFHEFIEALVVTIAIFVFSMIICCWSILR